MNLIRPLSLAAVAAAALALTACGDKDSGHAQKTEGEIKSAVGSAIGDKELKKEGQKDEVVGGVKSAGEDIKEAAKDAKD